MKRERPDPSEWTIRESVSRYLRRRQADATEGSVYGWKYRLKIWVQWCQGVGIQHVGELRPYDMDDYFGLRSEEVAPSTLEGEMWTLKGWARFLEDLGAVDDGLSDAVRIPDLDPEDRTNDEKLRTERAITLLHYFRHSDQDYGKRRHVFLELAWYTGARKGGLTALDLQDVHLGENPYVYFRHRPDTATPLKNKMAGERPVGLHRETADALKAYISDYRYDNRDDHGRQPLLTTYQGRPSGSSVRAWSYLATLPCQHSPCPHGKEPEECEWTEYSKSSKCPSSRSPHPIRTGAITWMLNRGWPPEDVAERVNADVRTIESHYDKADPEERRKRLHDRMEDRRRPLLNQLKLES